MVSPEKRFAFFGPKNSLGIFPVPPGHVSIALQYMTILTQTDFFLLSPTIK